MSELKFVPSEFAYVREVSKVDPLNKLHVVTSTNLSMSNILAFEEKCTYIPHPSDRNNCTSVRTKMIQEYRFQFTGLSILGTKLEEFIVNRFRMNAFKGRAALEQVLDKLKVEAIEVADRIKGEASIVADRIIDEASVFADRIKDEVGEIKSIQRNLSNK
ncbi:hypothetical protein O9G_000600 [Rozella allomycis CSF55]|uniref:PRELI/MSF1 domain-containing protein n=1 Tax=Rozella allomycis (strain CSF55) TaxID=988480 RepID=A0A075AVQ9_ROZAC|nr:hypothetical protein O9G_000600 [Rozella allomycis CSF55]|eukprot:EPZ34413.1 hypothetical protein O9G_000600 [Rozella allomycis CSF55]